MAMNFLYRGKGSGLRLRHPSHIRRRSLQGPEVLRKSAPDGSGFLGKFAPDGKLPPMFIGKFSRRPAPTGVGAEASTPVAHHEEEPVVCTVEG
jgi:hypothetical protein